jgi:5-bromo-4-chloroindolyl phosphate hydrolysis protein
MSRLDKEGRQGRPGLPVRRDRPDYLPDRTEGGRVPRGYDAFMARTAYKRHKMATMMGVGAGLLLAFAASAPWWLALGIGFAVYGVVSGASWTQDLRKSVRGDTAGTAEKPRIDETKIAKGQTAVANAVLLEARTELHRLLEAGRSIRDVEVRGGIGRLGRTAGDVVTEIEADANRLSRGQRLLTYYLPRAGDLAEGFALLERQREPDQRRIDQTREMITRLEAAFVHFADEMRAEEVSELDVDLRLLEQSLRQDIGPDRSVLSDPVQVTMDTKRRDPSQVEN